MTGKTGYWMHITRCDCPLLTRRHDKESWMPFAGLRPAVIVGSVPDPPVNMLELVSLSLIIGISEEQWTVTPHRATTLCGNGQLFTFSAARCSVHTKWLGRNGNEETASHVIRACPFPINCPPLLLLSQLDKSPFYPKRRWGIWEMGK